MSDDEALEQGVRKLVEARVYDEYTARSVMRLGTRGGSDPARFAQYLVELAAWERHRSGPMPTYGDA